MSPRSRSTDVSVEPQSQVHVSQQIPQPTSSPASAAEKPADEPRFDLSLSQILVGALAAAAAALAASSLGVAGTVTGAVVMSVVMSLSTALFLRPVQRSSRIIRETTLPDRGRVVRPSPGSRRPSTSFRWAAVAVSSSPPS